jgi:hypothetical protein
MVVNDNAGYLKPRGALTFLASMLAPTGRYVGASTLAMGVNDNAGNLKPRGALTFFASMLAPTGRYANTKGFAGFGCQLPE